MPFTGEPKLKLPFHMTQWPQSVSGKSRVKITLGQEYDLWHTSKEPDIVLLGATVQQRRSVHADLPLWRITVRTPSVLDCDGDNCHFAYVTFTPIDTKLTSDGVQSIGYLGAVQLRDPDVDKLAAGAEQDSSGCYLPPPADGFREVDPGSIPATGRLALVRVHLA